MAKKGRSGFDELTPNETRLLRSFARDSVLTRTHALVSSSVPREEIDELLQSLQEKSFLSLDSRLGCHPAEVFVLTSKGKRTLREIVHG